MTHRRNFEFGALIRRFSLSLCPNRQNHNDHQSRVQSNCDSCLESSLTHLESNLPLRSALLRNKYNAATLPASSSSSSQPLFSYRKSIIGKGLCEQSNLNLHLGPAGSRIPPVFVSHVVTVEWFSTPVDKGVLIAYPDHLRFCTN